MKSLGGGLVAALLLVLVWMALNPPRPHLNTSDVYTHLSVARHLVQGDGFVTDIAYPLSFAFDFAAELPQPLIHRGPAFALLLTGPVAMSQGDPAAAVNLTRGLQIILLGVLAMVGTFGLLRRGHWTAVFCWLILLGSNTLLGFAVDWAFAELPAALLLLGLWLRQREVSPAGPGWVDGLLAGILILFRWDLFWIPLLWWLWGQLERRKVERRNDRPVPALLTRRMLLAVVVLVAINLPWLVRNTQLTGQPFFSLQGQAELVKDTATWPGYSVYQQLQPQPVGKVLSGDPVPVLRKFVRGVKFHFSELGKLSPWLGLLLLAVVLVVYLRGSIDQSPCPLRRDAEHPLSTVPDESPLGPMAMLAMTLILIIAQYSFFDHSLRHLIVLQPLVIWELAAAAGLAARWKKLPRWSVAPGLALVAFLVSLTVQPLPGWQFAAEQAQRQNKGLAHQTRQLLDDPGLVPFVSASAAPWYANRAAVWDPQDEGIRNIIREKLSQGASRSD